jgi:hypothetical protein
MSPPSSGRKRWAAAGLLVLTFAVSFAVFDRLLLLGLRASASRYYASLAAAPQVDQRTTFTGRGDGDILIFGTSRSTAFDQGSLATRLDKRIVMTAYAGRNPQFNYFFYLQYRKEYLRPKAVFYGMDYFMFEKRSRPSELVFLGNTIKQDDLDPAGSANEASPLLSRVSWLFRKKPEIDDYLGDLIRLEHGAEAADENEANNAPTEDRGREPEENPAAPSGHNKSHPWKPHPFKPRFYQSFPGVEGTYLQKLLAALEEDEVPIFLVFIPDFVGTNETNFEQDKFKSDIGALAGPHKNATVLDFNRPDRFDLKNRWLFKNGGWGVSNCHLNVKGKIDFTLKFAKMVRPLLGQGSPKGAGPKSSR